jgi:hypothetical protein
MLRDSTEDPAALPDWVKDFRDPYGVPAWVYELRDRVATLEQRMEHVMTQETDLQAGFDTLTQTLTAVADDVKAKIAEIVALETQLADIQSTTSVDLSAAIAQAVAIRQSLEGTAAAASGAAAGGCRHGSTTTADQTGGGDRYGCQQRHDHWRQTGAALGDSSGGDATAAPGADAGTGVAPADGSQTADATA